MTAFSRGSGLVLAWMALQCVATSLSCGPASQPAERLNVVLLSVDTLRADHLGVYGYDRDTSPNIDRFFRDHEIYERAYSTHACTPPSVTSFLSGQYPTSHGVRFFNQKIGTDVRLLPDYLRGSGYVSAGIVSNYVLGDQRIGSGDRFDSYDDRTPEAQPTRPSYFERRASDTADAAIEWLETERDPEVPFLLWVHFIDPHAPYMAPSDETIADFSHAAPLPIDLERVSWHTRLPGVDDGLEYVDRYDEEIAYTDHHVGRILTAARELVLGEDTIFALVADHCETMLEHETYFMHCYHVWEPILRVPLLIARPGGPSRRVQHPVSAVDLTPSLILYATGEAAEADGFDGIPFEERGSEDVIRLEAQHTRRGRKGHILATEQGRKKWIVATQKDYGLREWFVDLERDPLELDRAPWTEGEGGRYLRAWNAAEGSYASRSRKDLPPSDIEVENALRALGYVE